MEAVHSFSISWDTELSQAPPWVQWVSSDMTFSALERAVSWGQQSSKWISLSLWWSGAAEAWGTKERCPKPEGGGIWDLGRLQKVLKSILWWMSWLPDCCPFTGHAQATAALILLVFQKSSLFLKKLRCSLTYFPIVFKESYKILCWNMPTMLPSDKACKTMCAKL